MPRKIRWLVPALILSCLGVAAWKIRLHWQEYTTDLLWRLGAGGAIGLAFLDKHAAAVGAFVAVAGFGVNLWFQWRRDRREASWTSKPE